MIRQDEIGTSAGVGSAPAVFHGPSKSESIEFYGLLHVAEDQSRPTNLSGSADPIDIYLTCAALCARSFKENGYSYHLITNSAGHLASRAADLGLHDIDLLELDFRWNIPRDVQFRSAHFKLELLEEFGRGTLGPRVGLVDLDTVLLRPFSAQILDHPGITAYDITSYEVESYGSEIICDALNSLSGEALSPNWWGGEFIVGFSTDFSVLSGYISRVWPKYLEIWPRLHHQGDEALTSAALSLMIRDGYEVFDAGEINDVHRWWSSRTLCHQSTLRWALNSSLLHLPSDKDFLSHFARKQGFDASLFAQVYTRYAAKRIRVRRLVDLAQRFGFTKEFKHTPRIG